MAIICNTRSLINILMTGEESNNVQYVENGNVFEMTLLCNSNENSVLASNDGLLSNLNGNVVMSAAAMTSSSINRIRNTVISSMAVIQ